MKKDFKEFHNLNIAELLARAPHTRRTFFHFHTACVGCGFARFCKLSDVVKTYQLEEKDFLETLSQHFPFTKEPDLL